MTDALAKVRADLAEYAEIRSVLHDAIECQRPPEQVTELLRQANDVADRIIGATIADVPPTGGWGEEILQSERIMLDDEPRPGSWFGDTGADGRMLTQAQTDTLIRSELWRVSAIPTRRAVLGEHRAFEFTVASHDGPNATGRQYAAKQQRGGIDSDPLVRLLAFRVWRDRDRSWFEDHGVRNGEAIVLTEPIAVLPHDRGAVLTIGRSWQERPIGHALEDGRPGETVKARIDTSAFDVYDMVRPSAGPFARGPRGIIDVMCRVGDRPRVAPVWKHATPDQILRDIGSIERVRVARYRREIENAVAAGGSEQDIAHHIALHTPLTHDDAAELLLDYRRFHEPHASYTVTASNPDRFTLSTEDRVLRAQYNQAPVPPQLPATPFVPPWARGRRKR